MQYAESPFDILCRQEEARLVKRFIDTKLDRRQAYAIRARAAGKTWREIGNKFHVGGQWARQIECKAHRILGHPTNKTVLSLLRYGTEEWW